MRQTERKVSACAVSTVRTLPSPAKGGLYFTYSLPAWWDTSLRAIPVIWDRSPNAQDAGRALKANGICLSPDQSMLYVSDPAGKWVWSYQVQADGTLANGEPFFRMETLDESSESGAVRHGDG